MIQSTSTSSSSSLSAENYLAAVRLRNLLFLLELSTEDELEPTLVRTATAVAEELLGGLGVPFTEEQARRLSEAGR